MLTVAIPARRLAQALLLCVLALVSFSCRAESLRVTVLLSDNSAPYLDYADAFGKRLPAGTQSIVFTKPDQLTPGAFHTDLIVAAGMKAAETALRQADTPVLVAMVSRTAYQELMSGVDARKPVPAISAIYLDQPWERQLDFVRAALPGRPRIGLLYSPETPVDIAGLRREAARRGAFLIAQPVESAARLFQAMENLLTDSDVLLTIPDSAIYSSNNIRNILLTSYRHNVPIVGISKAYVNAGALCAIFSTPGQQAVQAADAVKDFVQNRRLPAPQYPAEFTIEANQPVARSLGLEMPSPDVIRAKITKPGGAQ